MGIDREIMIMMERRDREYMKKWGREEKNIVGEKGDVEGLTNPLYGMGRPSRPPRPGSTVVWEAVVDVESGDIYYVHPDSGDTTWELPSGGRVGGKDGSEWEAVVDPQSGDTYYVNV